MHRNADAYTVTIACTDDATIADSRDFQVSYTPAPSPEPTPAPVAAPRKKGGSSSMTRRSAGLRWWRIMFGIVGLGALLFALARSRVSPEELGGILMSPLRMANDRMGDYVQV